jgi:hypothetical protein
MRFKRSLKWLNKGCKVNGEERRFPRRTCAKANKYGVISGVWETTIIFSWLEWRPLKAWQKLG